MSRHTASSAKGKRSQSVYSKRWNTEQGLDALGPVSCWYKQKLNEPYSHSLTVSRTLTYVIILHDPSSH